MRAPASGHAVAWSQVLWTSVLVHFTLWSTATAQTVLANSQLQSCVADGSVRPWARELLYRSVMMGYGFPDTQTARRRRQPRCPANSSW